MILTNEKLNKIEVPYSLINIHNYKNQTIKRFLHKIIKDKSFTFLEESITSNSKTWFIELEKGKSNLNNFYGNNRNLEIGKKCLTEVIGRIEEQSNLIARFLLINSSNTILNIKASGGLGKTTLVKKIAYELYNRGYYKKGVNFKSCENIKVFDDFEQLLIAGFNLANILNFKEYLIENYSTEKIDLLVILDNFETVVNNLDEKEYAKVIELLEFSSDYTNIVITSREKISTKNFEDLFTLTPMTTDDAVDLFKQFYKNKKNYTTEEDKILREEILEDLLANNPLAIKLVTSSRSYMKIHQLRDQIQSNFFESINEEYSLVFKNNADLNIERTKSIYQSINYSYSSLNAKQKLAFELLSLFPDGINLSDFKKCFIKNKSSNNITDTEIRQVENKSLLENYNGILQLQPIIRRFADHQFNKRKENKGKYCLDAYNYNYYILDFLEYYRYKKNDSFAIKLSLNVRNNLLQALEYIPHIEIDEKYTISDKENFLQYIDRLEPYLTNSKNISYFEEKIKHLVPYFSEIEDSEKLLNTMYLYSVYYRNEFDNSYEKLKKFLSVDEMQSRKFKDENNIEKKWKNLISNIHSMEGYTYEYLRTFVVNNEFKKNVFGAYSHLGINIIKLIKKIDEFYFFENQLRNNEIDLNELKEHIANLYMEEHLQIIQCTYTLSKLEEIPIKNINKLVVTNPYTSGLKNLMLAFNTKDNYQKIEFYKKAIYNLEHIKYYYLEAIYFYAKYLFESNNEEFNLIASKGLDLSKKYRYQYLHHLFNNLISNNNLEYNFTYKYYNMDGLEDFVSANLEAWQKY